ncbi:hypothetical protein EV715DRAFT_175250, partial [Schizophyllum commune]
AKPGPKPKAAFTSSAQDAPTGARRRLALGDWLTVFRFMDDHPDMKQGEVVAHFGSLKKGQLLFSQSALSKRHSQREAMEDEAQNGPANALSAKRRRVVTQPQVDKGLYLWTKRMEAKGESFTGPMLAEKRKRLEELFNVPPEERLKGTG